MLLGSKMEVGLTLEQKATNADTWRHIWFVQRFLIHTVNAFNQETASKHFSLIGLLRNLVAGDVLVPAYQEMLKEAQDLRMVVDNTRRLLRDVEPKDRHQYISKMLLERCVTHDQSKLINPELDMFVVATPLLAKCSFGTPEYDHAKAALGDALNHHYKHNRHHPEHFQRGIIDMDLVDVLEMLCDWMASSLRQPEGHILNSIEYCQGRFSYSDVMADQLRATYHTYFINEYQRDPDEFKSQKK